MKTLMASLEMITVKLQLNKHADKIDMVIEARLAGTSNSKYRGHLEVWRKPNLRFTFHV
jgi:hypothetical protein